MHNMLFLNLPVDDLARSRKFFTDLGYTINEKFSDENAIRFLIACRGEQQTPGLQCDGDDRVDDRQRDRHQYEHRHGVSSAFLEERLDRQIRPEQIRQ